MPEVDIVISIKSDVLIKRFMGSRWNIGSINHSTICHDILVSGGKYKFRCSALGSLEPKVTLLASNENGDQGVPIDVTINAVIPL